MRTTPTTLTAEWDSTMATTIGAMLGLAEVEISMKSTRWWRLALQSGRRRPSIPTVVEVGC